MASPHSTVNYTIPRGIMSIAAWSGGSIGAYNDVGNVVSAEITPELITLPHFTSRSGYRSKDAEPVVETNYSLAFVLDELARGNIARFLAATVSGNDVQAFQASSAEYAIKIVEDNPKGPNKTWNFWKVTLSAGGGMSIITTENAWAEVSYVANGLADTAGHATSPYITVTYSASTTTTTTT